MHSILIKFHVLLSTLILSFSGYAEHHELERADYKSEEAYLKSITEIAMPAAPFNVSSEATIMHGSKWRNSAERQQWLDLYARHSTQRERKSNVRRQGLAKMARRLCEQEAV